jgi:hypothetical protein
VVVLVYRSDSDSEINLEDQKAKMVKLLAKTQIEYKKLSDSGNFFSL